ncbi:MAG: hypothetical protein ABIM21_02215 [candidate division WOR-3 bacterium]
MKRWIINGGEKVRRGTYWNIMTGERVEIVEEEGRLPATGKYTNIHPVILLAIGPVAGLLYAIFLPFMGFAGFAYGVVRKVLETLHIVSAEKKAAKEVK